MYQHIYHEKRAINSGQRGSTCKDLLGLLAWLFLGEHETRCGIDLRIQESAKNIYQNWQVQTSKHKMNTSMWEVEVKCNS